MKKLTMFKLGIVIVLGLQAAACSGSPSPNVPPAGTKPAGQTETHDPVVRDIAAVREWTPATEGELTCYATDPYNRKLSYSWAADNGAIKGEGQKVTWVSPDTEGDYIVTVTVTNDEGGSASFKKTFKVTKNPYGNLDKTEETTINLKLSMGSSEIVRESASIKMTRIATINCVMQNEDPGALSFWWSVPAGKALGEGVYEGQARSLGWVAPGVKGEYTIGVIVVDKTGRQALGLVDFKVIDEFN